MPRGGQARQFSSDTDNAFRLYASPGSQPGPAYPYAVPYGSWWGLYGTPWYIQQTRKYKSPAPFYEFPRLGLHYLYPDAHHFGIVMPPDADVPDAGPYAYQPQQGVGARARPSPALSQGIELMRRGRYVDAGRVFASNLREDTAPPEQYLLVAEALWAAGKPQDAAIVLRHAIDSAGSLEFLDRVELAAHFPNRDALNEKLGATGDSALLAGTLNILAGNREKGLELLRGAADQDQAARRVYLHYIGSAFGPEKDEAPAPAPAPAGGANPPPAPKST